MKLSMMVSLICFVTSIPLIALGIFFKKKKAVAVSWLKLRLLIT